MHKRLWSSALLALAFTLSHQPLAVAQTNTCGSAVQQLQMYANQVNSVANWEFNQGIPGRCGFNMQCRQMLFVNLNAWYMQQANQVNQWYMQIVQQCTQQQTQQQTQRRLRTKRQSEDDPGEIDVASIDELTIDDEDKTVRIRIPSNPKGFR